MGPLPDESGDQIWGDFVGIPWQNDGALFDGSTGAKANKKRAQWIVVPLASLSQPPKINNHTLPSAPLVEQCKWHRRVMLNIHDECVFIHISFVW